MGAHLYSALGKRASVIGVAKTRYAGATHAIPVLRGGSKSPLFVTVIGMPASDAAERIEQMHGPHRIPTLLKLVDQLARSG